MIIKKIIFDITIGSYWPEHEEGEIVFPKGGESALKTIIFKTDGKNVFDDAIKALEKEMNGQSFHIWYWQWEAME